MTAIVTGAAGFIGSALVRRLASESTPIVGVDSMSYASSAARLEGLGSAFELVETDVSDEATMRDLFRSKRPSRVFHLAAESHVDRSIDDPLSFVRSNVLGSAALLEAARDADLGPDFRFIHVSTDEVFGALGSTGRFDLNSPYAPRSPYAASKAASDHLAQAWHHTYGLPVIVTNCSNNYGPYQFPEKLIPVTILRALAGKPIQVYGDGSNVRDWIHVDDHCRALLTVSERGVPGSTYLIGGDMEATNLDLVNQICGLLNEIRPRGGGSTYNELIEFVRDRPGHDWRYAIDNTATERELGWQPSIPFAEGMRDVVNWYLEREDWWKPLAADRYDGGRLGLGST